MSDTTGHCLYPPAQRDFSAPCYHFHIHSIIRINKQSVFGSKQNIVATSKTEPAKYPLHHNRYYVFDILCIYPLIPDNYNAGKAKPGAAPAYRINRALGQPKADLRQNYPSALRRSRYASGWAASQRSASNAAMQPRPAAVTAWRNTSSLTSPAANTPSILVAVESGAVHK